MQVTETLNHGLKREYKIAVPAAQLREKVDGKVNELSHKLKIPGFRPGKVPMSLLKQRYEQSVMGEVLDPGGKFPPSPPFPHGGVRSAHDKTIL